MAVYSWASPLLSDFSGLRMRRITWPVIRGLWKSHIWNPRPHFAYSLFNYSRGLRWRLRVVYSWASPLFSAENFQSPTKIGPKNGGFSQKWGTIYYIFIFKTPKRHILAWDRVFWRILREDQFWALGCSLFEEPKNEHLGVIFHAYGEKKPLVGSAQNFALGRSRT